MTVFIYGEKGNNEKIFIRFQYSKDIIKKIRTVNGRKWDPERKHWVIPFDEETLMILENMFKGEVVLEPSLREKVNLIRRNTNARAKILAKMDEELILRGYSISTRKNYLGHAKRFLGYHSKNYEQLTNNDLKSYLVYLLDQKSASHSFANQAISAIKFLFKNVLKIKGADVPIPRSKKQKKLPDILSNNEIYRILNQVKNIKHKAILYLTYSAGLRVS
jgi:integrase/recombinase XerD